ncbi:MAG: rhodanese-like domain-containing protein [Ilumatobacteraceae bacterium]
MTTRHALLVLLTVPALLMATGCGADPEPTAAAPDAAVADDTIIIDVRTPDEFAEGHLEGALNHNVEDGTLEAALVGLDADDEYIVYCRSGRRSAIAVELMRSKGFDTVTDLGSIDAAAAATGLSIVTAP